MVTMIKSRKNIAPATTTIIIETTIVHTEREPTVHIEHFFEIGMLEGFDLNIQCTLLLYGIHGYFNDPQVIYPELIKMFWRNSQLKDWKTIA